MKKSAIKRRIAACIFSLLCLPFFESPVQAAPLPDALGEWRAAPIQTIPLETASEDFGSWLCRDYVRDAPRANIEANLMDGSGPGTLRVPEGEIRKDDAPLGFASTYRTLDIAGRRAILEKGEVTGMALAVRLEKNRTLNLESKSVSEQELLSFAENMIAALQLED